MRYFRRFRMEFNFAERPVPDPELPPGYDFVAWDPIHLDRHAVTKFACFRSELDSQVFPSLSTIEGCQRLMLEIASQRTFLPEATWLICRSGQSAEGTNDGPVDCGTIQGLANGRDAGSVQNVGVSPDHRGLGLGRALVLQSLLGFQAAGMRRVFLEATAENAPAVELYRSVGFRLIRTTFRQVPDRSPAASE
jgi:GNAT superfamily N-acetyltransferase